jgi:hypothetical protein
MAESLFQKLEAEAYRKGLTARSKEARTWFRNKARELKDINRRQLLRDPMLTPRNRPGVGKMYMYFYDPKLRKELPYYDSFPLTIMVEPTKGGFYGLNLHYLSPAVRATFLDKLSATANNSKYDETTKLKINYNLLQSVQRYREFKPCFKKYLTSQIESRVVLVEPSEWDIAIFLPTEQFRKAGKRSVWADSKRIYRS